MRATGVRAVGFDASGSSLDGSRTLKVSKLLEQEQQPKLYKLKVEDAMSWLLLVACLGFCTEADSDRCEYLNLETELHKRVDWSRTGDFSYQPSYPADE